LGSTLALGACSSDDSTGSGTGGETSMGGSSGDSGLPTPDGGGGSDASAQEGSTRIGEDANADGSDATSLASDVTAEAASGTDAADGATLTGDAQDDLGLAFDAGAEATEMDGQIDGFSAVDASSADEQPPDGGSDAGQATDDASSQTDGGSSQEDASATSDGSAASDDAADSNAADANSADAGACSISFAPCRLEERALCKNGRCSRCDDVTDDARCAQAHGAGYLCIGGACVVAECHDDADCGGKTCDDRRCKGCHDDNGCADPAKPFCNRATGVCELAPPCSMAGLSCAADHFCCGATPTCKEIECCTDENCATKGPGFTCHQNACVAAATCPDVTNHSYFVDANATGASGQNGSTGCPFTNLKHGLDTIVATGDNIANAVTVTLRSDINESNQGAGTFPVVIPANVTLRGNSNTTRPTIIVPTNTTGFVFASPQQGGITQVSLKTGGGSTSGSGVWVKNTFAGDLSPNLNINFSRVSIVGFYNGIRGDQGGYMGIQSDVSSSVNGNAGLLLQDAYARIVVNATSVHDHFELNRYGIYVAGASLLYANATVDAQQVKTIQVSNNTYGIRFLSSLASKTGNATTVTNLLDNIEMNSNSAGNEGAGLYIYAGSTMRVRSCSFKDDYNGVRVVSNGTNDDVSAIELGTGDLSPGSNVFSGNTTLLCMAVRYDGSTLHAAENTFGLAHDCAVPFPGYDLTWARNCSSATDLGFTDWTSGVVSSASSWSIDVANCGRAGW
jgi:hypothetical protein